MTKILPALRVLLFALFALASAPIAGCGLKGDLILPQPPAASNPPAAQEAQDEQARDSGEGPG